MTHRKANSLLFTLLTLFSVLLAPALVSAETLAEGSFTKKDYSIEGTWKVVKSGNAMEVVFSDDFSTRKAPDLKLFFSRRPLSELTGKNALDGALRIGKLSSHKGKQAFSVPAGTDLSDYQTLIIQCEKFSKLWGGAPLRP